MLLKLLEMPPDKFQFCRRPKNVILSHKFLRNLGLIKLSVCTPFLSGLIMPAP